MTSPEQSADYPILGRSLHARIRGEGPVVLLVHGLGASSHIWERLALDGYRTVAVDLPGCGHSEPRQGSQGPRELGVVLGALLDSLSPEPFAIVGHSLGALVALEMALARPSRIKALALLDVPLELPLLARASSAPVLGEALFKLSSFAPASKTMVRGYLTWLFGDRHKITSDIVDAYTNASGRPHYWSAMLAGLRGISAWTHGGRLASLAVPTAVVWGEKDPLLPIELGHQLAELIPGAEVARLADCGHSPPEEAPEALAQVVRTFFERKAGFVSAIQGVA